MSQTQFGQTDALALAIVEWLNAQINAIVTNDTVASSPNIADTYSPAGQTYNGQPTYTGATTGLFLWFTGTAWAIGAAVNGAISFQGGTTINSSFTPQQIGYRGSATGSINNFCIPITAERRFALIDDLPSIPNANQPASVDVFPDIEISHRRGTSTAFESNYVVHIYIQQKTSGTDEEVRCALLVQLRSQIIEGIKLRRFNLDNAVHPVSNVFLNEIKNADKGMYGMQELLQMHKFESDTILIFKASV